MSASQAKVIGVREIRRSPLKLVRRYDPEARGRKLPMHRSECANDVRPCPFVSCRHHLFLDVDPHGGAMRINFPELLGADGVPDLERMAETCSLDVAERGEHDGPTVAALLGITDERVRQIAEATYDRFRSMPAANDNAAGEPEGGAGVASHGFHRVFNVDEYSATTRYLGDELPS